MCGHSPLSRSISLNRCRSKEASKFNHVEVLPSLRTANTSWYYYPHPRHPPQRRIRSTSRSTGLVSFRNSFLLRSLNDDFTSLWYQLWKSDERLQSSVIVRSWFEDLKQRVPIH